MRYQLLDKSGLCVSGLRLGTMTFVEARRQDVYGDTFELIDNHRTSRSGEAA